MGYASNPYVAWAHTLRDELIDRGYDPDSVSVEPSNVTLSPYEYVYVFFSDDRFDGPHALISQLAEYESGSTKILVGVHESVERFTNEESMVPEEVETVDDAIARMEELRAPIIPQP